MRNLQRGYVPGHDQWQRVSPGLQWMHLFREREARWLRKRMPVSVSEKSLVGHNNRIERAAQEMKSRGAQMEALPQERWEGWQEGPSVSPKVSVNVSLLVLWPQTKGEVNDDYPTPFSFWSPGQPFFSTCPLALSFLNSKSFRGYPLRNLLDSSLRSCQPSASHNWVYIRVALNN